MAFATVADLNARLASPVADEDRAGVLLEDASVYLSTLVTVDSTDETQAALLKTVCCSMVARVLSVDDDLYGVSNHSMGADIYSESFTYSNPTGDWYLTKTEREALGVGSFSLGTIAPEIHRGLYV